MSADSKIEWTDHTFNPWIGCTKVSPACDHCYAERQDHRFGGGHWGPGAERKRTKPGNWNEPRKWDRQAEREGTRYRVFCASLADVFDNEVPAEWRADLWALIRETPNLDWLLLTKRIGNAAAMLPEDWGDGWGNVWLGATVVTQEEVDRDIPLLGPLDLTTYLRALDVEAAGLADDPLAAHLLGQGMEDGNASGPGLLHWVIAGGESGPNARPMHPSWALSLRDQCRNAGVPFFFKQWGEWAPGGPDERSEEAASDSSYGEFHGGGDWVDCCMCREGTQGMTRLGKKMAGRQLDGETWDQVPGREVAPT